MVYSFSPAVCSYEQSSGINFLLQELVCDIPPVFQVSALRRREWVAAAIEDEINYEGALKVERLSKNYGYNSIFGYKIPWLTGDETIFAHKIDISAHNLIGITRNCYVGCCYFFIEENSNFSMVSSGDMYWMIAGPRDFVEEAIESSAEDQLLQFSNLVEKFDGKQSVAPIGPGVCTQLPPHRSIDTEIP